MSHVEHALNKNEIPRVDLVGLDDDERGHKVDALHKDSGGSEQFGRLSLPVYFEQASLLNQPVQFDCDESLRAV